MCAVTLASPGARPDAARGPGWGRRRSPQRRADGFLDAGRELVPLRVRRLGDGDEVRDHEDARDAWDGEQRLRDGVAGRLLRGEVGLRPALDDGPVRGEL